jgi:succinate dehydrogenase / fumarate reductase, cytochrome b subunit
MGVYQMSRYTLATSILNRFTGLALSLGLLLLVYWLTAVAAGQRAYGQASAVLALPVAKAVYLALIAAFSYHLVAGIRHLIWDVGVGMERAQARRSAWAVIFVSLVLFGVLSWAFLARTAG